MLNYQRVIAIIKLKDRNHPISMVSPNFLLVESVESTEIPRLSTGDLVPHH